MVRVASKKIYFREVRGANWQAMAASFTPLSFWLVVVCFLHGKAQSYMYFFLLPAFLAACILNLVAWMPGSVTADEKGLQLASGRWRARRRFLPYEDIVSVEVFALRSRQSLLRQTWPIGNGRSVAIVTRNGEDIQIVVPRAEALAALLHDMCHLSGGDSASGR